VSPGYASLFLALDKRRSGRHEQRVVSRSLWLFVLVSAFLVVGARCMSVFLSVDAGTSLAVSVTQGSGSSSNDDDFATGAAIDDDSDESSDALLAPSSVVPEVAIAPAFEVQQLSFAGQQLALSSHARGLDRPPRA